MRDDRLARGPRYGHGTAIRLVGNTGMVAFKAYESNKTLDPVVMARCVRGVQHLPSDLPLQGVLAAAATGDGSGKRVVAALQEALGMLGSSSGFLTLTHVNHTVALLPDRSSDGTLTALTLFNFIGNQLVKWGEADGELPGFAVRIAASGRRSLWDQAAAVLDALYLHRCEGMKPSLQRDVLQFDVFQVQPGTWVNACRYYVQCRPASCSVHLHPRIHPPTFTGADHSFAGSPRPALLPITNTAASPARCQQVARQSTPAAGRRTRRSRATYKENASPVAAPVFNRFA